MNAFDKIIGYKSIVDELLRIADILRNTEEYRRKGVNIPHGLLLHGEPGLGKTLMTKCLIEESNRHAFFCRKDKHNGDFVDTVRETFETAIENEPSIIVLDDMDKFANDDEHHRNSEEYITVQSCIDSVKERDVYVVATANSLRNLPSSLIRSGRFDKRLKVSSPSLCDSEKIVAHYLSGIDNTKEVDARMIAGILSGYSCATLESVVNEAGMIACYNKSDCITTEHMIEAILRSVFNVKIPYDSKETPVIDLSYHNYASEMIYHEAGHAVIAELVEPKSVALMSAFTRDLEEGGFIRHLNKGRPVDYKTIEGRVLVSLAGKAAVDVKYGVNSIGTILDNRTAYHTLSKLYQEECFGDFRLYQTELLDVSDTQNHIAHQIVTIKMAEYYQKVKRLLTQNRDFLDRLAEALASNCYLTLSDIQRIKEDLSCQREAS